MTPGEFKAWFDGFVEAFDGKVPTGKQWTRIKERVAEIDGRPITERVFVDRWWPYVHHHYPYWGTLYHSGSPGGIYSCNTLQRAAVAGVDCQNLNVRDDGHSAACNSFDAPTAMYALGKADAACLSST
jgi:hypothetical protein